MNESFDKWCRTAYEIPDWFTMRTAKTWELIFEAGQAASAARIAELEAENELLAKERLAYTEEAARRAYSERDEQRSQQKDSEVARMGKSSKA